MGPSGSHCPTTRGRCTGHRCDTPGGRAWRPSPPGCLPTGGSRFAGAGLIIRTRRVRLPLPPLLLADDLSSVAAPMEPVEGSRPGVAGSSTATCTWGTRAALHLPRGAPTHVRSVRTATPRPGSSPFPSSVESRYLLSTIYLLGIDFKVSQAYIPSRDIPLGRQRWTPGNSGRSRSQPRRPSSGPRTHGSSRLRAARAPIESPARRSATSPGLSTGSPAPAPTSSCARRRASTSSPSSTPSSGRARTGRS